MNTVTASICDGVRITFASNAGVVDAQQLEVAAHLRPHDPRKQAKRTPSPPQFVAGLVLLLLPTRG